MLSLVLLFPDLLFLKVTLSPMLCAGVKCSGSVAEALRVHRCCRELGNICNSDLISGRKQGPRQPEMAERCRMKAWGARGT